MKHGRACWRRLKTHSRETLPTLGEVGQAGQKQRRLVGTPKYRDGRGEAMLPSQRARPASSHREFLRPSGGNGSPEGEGDSWRDVPDIGRMVWEGAAQGVPFQPQLFQL